MHSAVQFRKEQNPFLPMGARIGRLPTVGDDRIATLQSDRTASHADLVTWMKLIRLADVERELLAREQQIKELQQQLASAKYANREESRLASVIVEVVGRILEMSQHLFPGPVTVEYSFDPENPSDEYVVFDVVAHGEYKDYRDREYQWHEEVEKIVPGTLGEFRLCVFPIR